MIPTHHAEAHGQEGQPHGADDHHLSYQYQGLYDGPPPPDITSPSAGGIVSIDITGRFRKAASTLQAGQLVKDGYFELLDAVSAIEIMDPKMDSGVLGPGEDSLDEEYDLSRKLDGREVVGIIDQLLCLEMAWHLGYPLSQTLFTNVYIEGILNPDPRVIDDADFLRDQTTPREPMLVVLRAYCLGLLKACFHVNERIRGEHYYEEEDFVTNTYRRSLLGDFDDAAIQRLLGEALEVVEANKETVSEEVATALFARLKLRESFLTAIHFTEQRTNSDSLKTPWIKMEELLQTIKETHPLQTPVPEAFSTKIQRKLASTMPPRPIVQLSFEDTYGHLKRLFGDGREVNDVLNYTNSQTLLAFVLHFQSKSPQPLVYIRTLLQSYLFRDMVILGALSIRQIVDDDLSTLVLPCSPLLDATNDLYTEESHPNSLQHRLSTRMEAFRQRAAQSYLDIFRAICQNRCRIRRTLCHCIQDWENVQFDAEEVDVVLASEMNEPAMAWPRPTSPPSHSLSLSSWAYLYKLKLMEWIVQLGFELDVYAPDELGGMYLYLSQLSRTKTQHIQCIKAFAERNVRDLMRTRQLTPEEEGRYDRAARYWLVSQLDAVVTRSLSDALSSLYTVLARLKLITPPPRPYSTDQMRYEVRMQPFSTIALPQIPDFESFTAGVLQEDRSNAEVLDLASAAVEDAKRGLKALERLDEEGAFATGTTFERWKAGVAGMHKSAIAAGLAIGMLKKIVGGMDGKTEAVKDGKRLGWKVERKGQGKRYHEWWDVPVLVKA